MSQPTSSTGLAGAWEEDVEPLFERDEAPARARNVKRTLGPALLFLGCVGSIGVMRRAQLTSQWPWEEMSEVGRVAVSVGAGMDAVPTVLPDGDDGAAPASTTDDDAAACDATAWAGEDYQYMFGAVWDSDEAVASGARLRRWRAQYGSVYTACNVSVSRLDLVDAAGTTVPSPDATRWFTIASDAYLVVGNVSVTLEALTEYFRRISGDACVTC